MIAVMLLLFIFVIITNYMTTYTIYSDIITNYMNTYSIYSDIITNYMNTYRT